MIDLRFSTILLCGVLGLSIGAASCASDARRMAPVRQQAKIPLSDCGFATYTTEVLCGKLEVFEDPAARTGRKITLDIVLLPASDAAAEPEPIFFLAGGPGQGAARIAGAGEDALMSQLRRRRDLVFIDQRGTGSSQALHCNLSAEPARLQSYFDELFPVAKVRACRAALEPKPTSGFTPRPWR